MALGSSRGRRRLVGLEIRWWRIEIFGWIRREDEGGGDRMRRGKMRQWEKRNLGFSSGMFVVGCRFSSGS